MLLMILAIMNAECRVYCLNQYDTGEYRNGNCACVNFFDYKTATQKYKPKRIITDNERPFKIEDHE